jgi:hypothetical protein
MKLFEAFIPDVDHMPGRTIPLSKAAGHTLSDYAVTSNPPTGKTKKYTVKVKATSYNHAVNLAFDMLTKQGLKPGQDFDGFEKNTTGKR